MLTLVVLLSVMPGKLVFADVQGSDVKKVFIVHSYSRDNICGYPQHQGVEEVLAENGFKVGENLVLSVYAMETKKKNNTPELVKNEGERALLEINKVKPDVVVVLDDNAFRTVGLALVDKDTSVVYSGMNGQPEDYDRIAKWLESRDRPGHNITGVYEKLLVLDAFRVQKMIVPDLKKVLFVSDNSPTGKAVQKQFVAETSGRNTGVDIEMHITDSWEEYKAIIQQVDNGSEVGAIYPAATKLKDKDGKFHATEEIIRWTVENSRTPGIPLNYSFARLGMLGGAGVDFISMGRQAGEMVAKILKGTPAGEIPIEDARRYALVFNLKRARDLGLEIPNDMLMAADVVYK